METEFQSTRVSIAVLIRATDDSAASAAQECIASALNQDHPATNVLVVDSRGPDAPADFLPDGASPSQVRHLPGDYANRAAMCNAALAAADGALLLLIPSDRGPVSLKRSAVRTLVMAATRSAGRTGSASAPGMVYADYERIEPDGSVREVHLLDWHAGRLRDTVDFGAALLFDVGALRDAGGFDESLKYADLYDVRLRISAKRTLVHVANRFAGSLYSVRSPATAHNVFDYLLAGRDAQLEMERVCTEHLKRTGAYLSPAANVRALPSRDDADGQSGECIASVVTPVNNRPEFIGQAIESVQAQTEQRVEMIVVVNGGPSDPTADEVRRYMPSGDRYDAGKPAVRLVVVDVNNLGLCLNAGVEAARGKYYVQLDSDDRLKPDAVEKLLAVFESDPTVGMVIGSYEVWTLDQKSGELHRNEEIPVVTHGEWTADNGRNNLLRINGAGAPRSANIGVIREVGWFGVNDTASCRNYGEDYDLVLRISERYTIGRVWEPIYEVIRHAGGTDHAIDQATIDRNDDAKDRMRLEALHRRRMLGLGTGGGAV